MLKLKDLHFCGASVVDTFGRVFEYQGVYYRIIYNSSETACRELLESNLFKDLIRLQYIPKTEITDEIQVEGNPLILKHDTCYISKPYEWSFEMYKDAAIHILKVNEICNKYGFELKDAHPFNITFHNGKPLFIDIGSISKRTGEKWGAKDEFLQITCLPLILWAEGEYGLARHILESDDMYAGYRLLPQQSFLDSLYLRQKILLNTYYQIRLGDCKFSIYKKNTLLFFRLINKITHRIFKKKLFHISCEQKYIDPTIDYLSKLTLKKAVTEWENYQCYDEIESRYPRFMKIVDLINKFCPDADSAIDLAGNSGDLSIILHKNNRLNHIFTIDYDSNAIDKAYSFFKKNKLPIDTICSNVILPFNPTSLYARAQSDIAIACALTHHLILRQDVPLYAIFEKISHYTKKYVIIEFMPLGLWDGKNAPPIPAWYSEEWFKDMFEKYFTLIHQEQLETNRILFIGKKHN